ncbi:MYG1 family protein [Sulfurimonas sp. SAG-AH-194-I05]|nr:MYG1 family protein [Sulfurimonas sp. SAG-AH-194-I05]MDF1875676.1 MYG1 family protein [Sulfurimonas sp. SAG-AH-194-I05]
MIKQVATHNKIFHADEVTAIALLKIFTNNTIEVSRVNHNTTDFTSYDMVIDIGKKFDGEKHFDHHQYKGGKSSAGIIWEYLSVEKRYPKISKLINLIDMNDTGIQKAKPFEFSSLLKAYNHHNIGSKEQDLQFEKAVEFAMTILASMKKAQEDFENAKEIVNNSFVFNNNHKIIELETFTSHWARYINGVETPEVQAVVWEDTDDMNWKVRIPSKRLGSFELNAKALKQDDSMEFVHSSGHFAIAKDEEGMKRFLTKQIK